MTEREISAQSVRWLRAQGCIAIKLSTLSRYGTAGWPDYLVVDADPTKGCWFLEFKQPGKRLTALQKQRQRELELRGAYVATSSSLEETKRARMAA